MTTPGGSPIDVCVASAFSEHKNRNLDIVHYLARGLEASPRCSSVRAVPQAEALAALKRYKPGMLVLVGSCLPSSSNYNDVFQAAKDIGCTTAFWTVEDPYEIDAKQKFERYVDLIFTNEAEAVPYYARGDVFHLPTAAEPQTHYRSLTPWEERSFDVAFCGVAYPNRRRLFRDLRPMLEPLRVAVAGAYWPQDLTFARNERIARRRLPDFYAASRIVLNVGRDYALANERWTLQATAPGPRTYEAALAGCVQLYHLGSHAIERDFVPSLEILTFASVKEFKEKVNFLLANADWAMKIADAAQRRALLEHTYVARAARMLDVYFKHTLVR